MDEYLILKFLHLLAFVYWLGGDLGTFLSSRYVVRADIGPEARATALKIMLACDQGPKTSMPLIFPLGLQLAQLSGATHLPGWVMPPVWLVAAVWALTVQYLYFTDNQAGKARLTRVDFMLRVGVISLILFYIGGSLLHGDWAIAERMRWKMLIFAALVACGLLIRVRLKPFVAAFGQLMSAGPSTAVNRALARALARVRPWVWLIWAGLLTNAALGLRLL